MAAGVCGRVSPPSKIEKMLFSPSPLICFAKFDSNEFSAAPSAAISRLCTVRAAGHLQSACPTIKAAFL